MSARRLPNRQQELVGEARERGGRRQAVRIAGTAGGDGAETEEPMTDADALLLPPKERQELWLQLVEAIERYLRDVEKSPVAGESSPAELRDLLAAWDFAEPVAAARALDFAVENLWRHQVHTPHPRYFGLFNPAAFNPQLAAWSHSPFAAEVEQHLVRSLAGRFGYDPAKAEGSLTSGGAEANLTAVTVALLRAFPEVGRRGLLALRSQPSIYLSPQAHHSFVKAARVTGLGTDAVREVATDASLRMRADDLAARLAADRADGYAPFLVVATAGSTSAGTIDPIAALAEVAEREGIWLHVDAAWGGAAALLPELRQALAGIERASSITFDPHKWLSMPMGAGLFLTRQPGALERTFRVTAGYMPRAAGQPAGQSPGADPYVHSMQWSRRFIGLKLFLSLAVAGWRGYEDSLRHQVAMGERLRRGLAEQGWEVVNETPLPIVCFLRAGARAARLEALAAAVVASGEAWISTVNIDSGTALRACITNFRTGAADVDALIAAVGRAWERQEGAAEGHEG
jgi:glutamate/tyrosine decarboxylase-like PLP-dependent enzyme